MLTALIRATNRHKARAVLAVVLHMAVAWAALAAPGDPVPVGPSVTTLAQGESLGAAYRRLKPAGGKILVPYRADANGVEIPYGCGVAMWYASRMSSNVPYYSVIIEGVAGPNGQFPTLACAKGTLVSFGPPVVAADGKSPSPNAHVRIQFRQLKISGWTRALSAYGIDGFSVVDVTHDGMCPDGANVCTGKGWVITEKLGKGPQYQSHSEFVRFHGKHAGGGNQDHMVYVHCGQNIERELCSFTFHDSSCRAANASHCIKSGIAGHLSVKNSQFVNSCSAGEPCGTQTLDWLVANSLAEIENNVFIYGNKDNPTTKIPGVSLLTASNRKYFDPAVVGGGAFSPLFDLSWADPAFHDSATWEAMRVAGDSAKRRTFFRNNTIWKFGTADVPAIRVTGTYPNTATPVISDCLTPLSVPPNWFELAEFHYSGNTFYGKYPVSGVVVGKTGQYCGVYPPPPLETGPTIIDGGGNLYFPAN